LTLLQQSLKVGLTLCAADLKKAPRLHFLDTGLVNYRAGLQGEFFKYKELHAFHQGRIAEHIVGQELLAAATRDPAPLAFWVKEKKQSNAEVDFLFPHGNLLLPVEVKAGPTGTLRSLHQFIDHTDHGFAIRLHAGPLRAEKAHTPAGKNFTLLNLPYFLTGLLTKYAQRLIEGAPPGT
jgi:hypothetical protein